MTKLQTGPLPKIEGSGRKPAGLWAGHAKEAQELRELAKTNPQDWAKIGDDLKPHAASRVAHLINHGDAVDFPATADGHYEARTRRNARNDQGSDLWARFVPQTRIS